MASQLFAGKKRKFDMLGWRQFMVSPRGTIVYAATKTGVKGMDSVADIKALKGKVLRYGAKTPTSSELRIILAFELLGMNVETVFGLARGAARKAIQRGELQVSHDSSNSYLRKVRKLEKKGIVKPLFTLGYPEGGKIARDPVFPNILTVAEVYEKMNGKAPSGPNWRALEAFIAMSVTASKGFALPKGTPDDIYNAYVKAAKMSVKDKEFKKRAKKILGKYPQVFGKEANDAVTAAVGFPPEVQKWLKAYIKTKFNVKL
ncbi:MAG: tripartite-type tricarboxylate transporter receptor subunit TctC [Alphaproteobacteria bacterium]|jgi:tripartite-type tricarboxylate transporter receptor subunit TctC